jgi:RimJ/RimL family protein N-acetyltransferase
MDRIVTERLILRRAREDDLEAMHAVLSHPVGMRYWSSLPHRHWKKPASGSRT